MLKNRKIRDLGIFTCILVLSASFSIMPINYAEAKIDENTCKQMYVRYKDMGESKFREKYSGSNFLTGCLKLYKDPTWNFAGKSKIDKNYAKIEVAKNTPPVQKIDVKTLTYMSMGPGKFLIKFRACTDTTSITKPTFLVQSNNDKLLVASSKILQKGACNDYNVQVKAKQKTDISVEYVTDLSQYKYVRTIRL